jgi:hypothetical protein
LGNKGRDMNYSIHGPFEIKKNSRNLPVLDKNALKYFWDNVEQKDPGLSGACGNYVYAIRAAKGCTPLYVGKAAKQEFRKECFSPHKIKIY